MKLAAYQESLEASRVEAAKLAQANRQQQAQIGSLTEEVGRLTDELAKVSTTLEQSQQVAHEAQQVLEQSKDKLESEAEKSKGLEKRIEQVQAQHKDAINEFGADKEVLVEKHAAEMTQLESELQGSQADVAGLEESLAGQGQSLTERQAQVEKLGGDLAALNQAHSTLQQRAKVSDEAGAEAIHQLAEQAKDLGTATNRVQALIAQLLHAQNELKASKEQVQNLTFELGRADQAIDKLNEDLDDMYQQHNRAIDNGSAYIISEIEISNKVLRKCLADVKLYARHFITI